MWVPAVLVSPLAVPGRPSAVVLHRPAAAPLAVVLCTVHIAAAAVALLVAAVVPHTVQQHTAVVGWLRWV